LYDYLSRSTANFAGLINLKNLSLMKFRCLDPYSFRRVEDVASKICHSTMDYSSDCFSLSRVLLALKGQGQAKLVVNY